jgi:nucleotide-binding universal stress UspA family protein
MTVLNKGSIAEQEESSPLNKVLLAIDGSVISWNTADAAIEAAKILGLELFGLYVIDEELVVDDYADYQKELGIQDLSLSRSEKASLFENQGNEILKRLKSLGRNSGIQASTEIGLGGVGEMILKQAQNASILAIGRRGNGHADGSDYLGKNFCHVAHRSKIPLLVGGDWKRPFKRILTAYNGRERAQKALDWVRRLQSHRSFELLFLVVQEENNPSVRIWEEEIKSEFSQNQIEDSQLITRHGNAAEQIAEAAMKNNSDIVIMGGYRHTALLEWLEGSTLDSVLRKIPLPVLVA